MNTPEIVLRSLGIMRFFLALGISEMQCDFWLNVASVVGKLLQNLSSLEETEQAGRRRRYLTMAGSHAKCMHHQVWHWWKFCPRICSLRGQDADRDTFSKEPTLCHTNNLWVSTKVMENIIPSCHFVALSVIELCWRRKVKLSSVKIVREVTIFAQLLRPSPLLGPYRIINVLDTATAKEEERFCTALFSRLH